MAAALPSTTWAKIEPTLWRITLVGRVRTTHYKYCFSFSHSKQHCELSPALLQTKDTQTKSNSIHSYSNQVLPSWQRHICNDWNYNPAQCCLIIRCCYRHIYLQCSRNSRIIDKSHKVMFCYNFPGQTPTHTAIPSLVQPSSQLFQA